MCCTFVYCRPPSTDRASQSHRHIHYLSSTSSRETQKYLQQISTMMLETYRIHSCFGTRGPRNQTTDTSKQPTSKRATKALLAGNQKKTRMTFECYSIHSYFGAQDGKYMDQITKHIGARNQKISRMTFESYSTHSCFGVRNSKHTHQLRQHHSNKPKHCSWGTENPQHDIWMLVYSFTLWW